MRKGDIDFYQKQEIENFLSNRTELYNLEPMGLGTAYIESLSSYISRLALAHNVKVSVLLKKVIGPHLNIEYLKKELDLGMTKGSAAYINEMSNTSLEYVNALEAVTGRNDLLNLTMLNWRGIFSKQIRSKSRKWCPKCLEEWKLESRVIYEPLIWFLNDIQKCDIHKIQLENVCSNCKKELPFLHNRYQNGFCQYCESWLGEQKEIAKVIIKEEEAYTMYCYKQLIGNIQGYDYFPSKLWFGYFIKGLLDKDKFKSLNGISSYLGFSGTTVSEWAKHKYLPTSKSLIFIGYKLQSNLVELIYNPNVKLIDFKEYDIKKTRPSKSEIHNILIKVLKKPITQSLYKISEKNNFLVETAQSNFPELCNEIKTRYLVYLEQLKFQRKIEIIDLLNEQLNAEVPISLEKLSKISNYSKKVLRKNAPDLCFELVRRHNEYLFELKMCRIEIIERDIRITAINLHNQGFYPSKRRIQILLNNKNLFLEKEVRILWKEIMRSLGYILD